MTGSLQSRVGPEMLYRGSPTLTNITLLLLGSALLALSHHITIEFDHFVIGLSETSLCALGAFLGAAAIILRQPVDRRTLYILCVFAVLFRLVLLMPFPYLSSDIYRYVWDGMVQHHGINPYHYIPGDQHLAFMRDDDVFPSINRRDTAPTIYPPVAQMMFYLITAISPTVQVMKLVFYAFEGVSVWAMIRMLEQLGLRRELVVLYVWNPLVLWEIGSSGHIDGPVITFLCLALLLRLRQRDLETGLSLGTAVLMKFYPLVLLPALFQRGRWKVPAVIPVMAVIGYAVYSSVGRHVFGYASGYAQEEGMTQGTRFFLLDAARRLPHCANLPLWVFLMFCFTCAIPLLVWAWKCSSEPGGAFLEPAGATAFVMMLLFSPHYPWYVLWLIPFLVLRPNLPMLVYTSALFYACTTRWAMPGAGMFFLNTWIYTATAVAFALECMLRWRLGRPPLVSPQLAVRVRLEHA